MLYDLSVVCFVVEAYDSPKVFEGCQFQVLLGALHELSDPGCKALGEYEVFAAEVVLSDEEAEYFHQMGVKGYFLHSEIIHC